MPETEQNAQSKDARLLSDSEIAEIEARAKSASPHYVVDWSKGEHALLQESGWRAPHEEQPRTIATFDADDGYLDLLFCVEARTDIPALCNTVRALQEIERTALKRAEKYCDRPDDMPVSAIVNVAFNVLESRLLEVEKERDDLRSVITAIGQCQHVPKCKQCAALVRATLRT